MTSGQTTEDTLISLKISGGWQEKIDKLKLGRVYPLSPEDRKIVDSTMDKLHEQGRADWVTTHSPSGCYPVFVTWRMVIRDGKPVRKGRMVVDIYHL